MKSLRKAVIFFMSWLSESGIFVVGNEYPQQMKRIVEEGHSIAVHSVTHNYRQIYASREAYFEDIYGMQDIIRRNTGVTTTLMRFPGGSSNLVSSFNEGIMTYLTEAVQDAGFQYFDWNVRGKGEGRREDLVHCPCGRRYRNPLVVQSP